MRDAETGDPLGKVAEMQTESTIEPLGRRHHALARLVSVIRGDKYMVDAYPPDAPGRAAPDRSQTTER
jgi:hypothetical protein